MDFLILQELFPSETAAYADVLLPGASFAEKSGTFTNTDRRVQLGRQAIDPPGEARQDLDIIIDMATRLGLDWHFDGPRSVFDEMREAMPSIAGITWERLEKESAVTYPCRHEADPGDAVIFTERFPRPGGRALLVAAGTAVEQRVIPAAAVDDIVTDLKTLIKNKAWLVMVIAGVFTLASVAIRGAATVYFFKYNLLDDNTPFIWIWDRTSFFITTGSIVFVIGVIAGRFLSNVYDKRSLMLFLTLSNAIIMGLIFFIPKDDYWTLLAANAVASLLAGPTPALVWSMYGDVADFGEWKFKRRSTGLVFSAAQFAQKLGLTLGGVLPTAVLTYVGYEANVAQSETALLGIRMIFTWVPAAFAFVAGLAFIYYPLRDAQLVQIEKDLVNRRLAMTPAVS